MTELKDLRDRLRNVIVGTCNEVGCKGCDLKWDGGCSASELEGRIMDIEILLDGDSNGKP